MAIFHGGIHPTECKFSAQSPIEDVPPPAQIALPLVQHRGTAAQAVVQKGERVKRGQVVGEVSGNLSARVHSPIAGEVRSFDTRLNQAGEMVPIVVIANDGSDEWAIDCNQEISPIRAPEDFSATEIIDTAQWAGIVGMGGAMFPLAAKLSPPPDKKIDLVIINGVECEPYLTADARLQTENPREICFGARAICTALDAKKIIFAVEDNKPDAIAALQNCRDFPDNAELKILPTVYPQGAEKQLVFACIGKEISPGGLPADVGVSVHNSATAFALSEALFFRRPLMERVVTISGDAVKNPRNFRARLGTAARELLDRCNYDLTQVKKIVYGGPMMGFAHFALDLPLIKGCNGILLLRTAVPIAEAPCLRCGRCIEKCPCRLLPAEFSMLAERERYLETVELSINACIECGCCSFVCPAKRPLIQAIKVCKNEIAAANARQAAS